MHADVPVIQSNPNPIRKRETPARFTPPTVEEVAEYCKERGNSVNAQRFVDFYACKGWKVGRNPMKDWKAAVRTWEQRDDDTPSQPKAISVEDFYKEHGYA